MPWGRAKKPPTVPNHKRIQPSKKESSCIITSFLIITWIFTTKIENIETHWLKMYCNYRIEKEGREGNLIFPFSAAMASNVLLWWNRIKLDTLNETLSDWILFKESRTFDESKKKISNDCKHVYSLWRQKTIMMVSSGRALKRFSLKLFCW